MTGVAGHHRGVRVVERGHRLVGQGVDLLAELLGRHVELVARATADPVVDEQGRATRAAPGKDRQPSLHGLAHGQTVAAPGAGSHPIDANAVSGCARRSGRTP